MDVKIRLTPTLFDKLVHGNPLAGLSGDDDIDTPSVSREDLKNYAVANVERFTEESLRASIRKDLAWLLNTLSFESSEDLSKHPWVQKSVLNYGIRDFSGRSKSDRSEREHAREIRAAILRFEPRLDPRTLRVEAVKGRDVFGKNSYIIEGDILGVPNLMPIRFQTDIDVETSAVEVSE